MNKIAVFLVGIGAPASLYIDYFDDLKAHLPETNVFVLEWWKQDDFGISALQSYLGKAEMMLIGHSAGSVIALQALAKWPASVKKIIMLDSHFQRSRNALPTVNGMLEIMLSQDPTELQDRVKNAYAPILENDLVFNRALEFAIKWVNDSFDQACTMLDAMPAHSALQIGFTNLAYQMLNAEDEKTLFAFWEEFGVDVECLPMNHFDLIDEQSAASINQVIAGWLCL
jgi:pimeloyl-ACP methyl ester carboxylesterase